MQLAPEPVWAAEAPRVAQERVLRAQTVRDVAVSRLWWPGEPHQRSAMSEGGRGRDLGRRSRLRSGLMGRSRGRLVQGRTWPCSPPTYSAQSSGAPVTGITSDFSRSLERHTGTTLAACACPAPFRNELPHTRVEPSWPVTIGVTAQHSAASASDGQQAVARRRPAPRAQVAHRGGPAACESRGSIRARTRAAGLAVTQRPTPPWLGVRTIGVGRGLDEK